MTINEPQRSLRNAENQNESLCHLRVANAQSLVVVTKLLKIITTEDTEKT